MGAFESKVVLLASLISLVCDIQVSATGPILQYRKASFLPKSYPVILSIRGGDEVSGSDTSLVDDPSETVEASLDSKAPMFSIL